MGFPVKKEKVKFCPFCGSGQITHVANGNFFCGFNKNATEQEVVSFLEKGGRLCGRGFSVVHGRGNFKEFKQHFQDVTQPLFRQDKLMPSRRVKL